MGVEGVETAVDVAVAAVGVRVAGGGSAAPLVRGAESSPTSITVRTSISRNRESIIIAWTPQLPYS